MTQSILDMFMNKNITEWKDFVIQRDVPDYFLTFAGLMTTAFTLSFDDTFVDQLLPVLMELFGMPEDQRDFTIDYYVPEVNNYNNNAQMRP